MPKTKHILIKFPSVKITFATWYEWYGDRYDGKLEAVEVWNQMTARDRSLEGDSPEISEIEYLGYGLKNHFGDLTDRAEAVIASHKGTGSPTNRRE